MREQMNGTATNGAAAGDNGRTENGQFAAGNKGGPGNPFARRTAAMRKAISEAITPEELAAVARVVLGKAMAGDMGAARLLFAYAGGKAAAPPDPDMIDAHELMVRRKSVATPEDVAAATDRLPAPVMCELARLAEPAVRKKFEGLFDDCIREREGRQRRAAEAAATPPPDEATAEEEPVEVKQGWEALARLLDPEANGMMDRLRERRDDGEGRWVPKADGKRGKRRTG